jgi:hypothetical protein
LMKFEDCEVWNVSTLERCAELDES